MSNLWEDFEVMLRAQIDNDRDSVGGSGIPEVTFRQLPFAEHRTFAKRSHVKDRKGFDMTYFGSTRVVDQASAHSLPLTVAGRHTALNPTDSTHGKPKSFGFEFPVLTKESGKQRIAAVSSVESPLRRVRIRLRTPPPTLCSCTEYETLAIAPHSQRHVCQIDWLARSLFLQSRRMSPFRRPVSAAENSVPDSTFGDLVRSLRGGQPVWSRSSPPPTLCSCTEHETLAIAPHSQRHVCQIDRLARSLFLQSRRMSPFRRPVSAAENSVPDSTFGDLVRSLRGGQQKRSRRQDCGDTAPPTAASRRLHEAMLLVL